MYKIDPNGVITRISDGKVIPRDITNVDYQTFLYVQANGQDPQTHGKASIFNSRDNR